MRLSQLTQLPHFNYLVRVINPEQRSKFIVKIWHDTHEKFERATELKTKLVASFEDKLPPLSGLECGYLHKGSKRWIENDQDLEAMYKLFTSGDEITIWCEGRRSVSPEMPARSGRKRKADEPEPSTKQADRIYELAHELYEKHGETYSMPQLRLWARMLLNKQYKSMDKAPPYPPFLEKVPKARKHDNLSDALTSAATAVVGLLNGTESSSTCMSPGKRARVSGQYLEHLEKLKNLHQSGVLSIEEFEEQKKFALDNIRKINETPL